MGRPAAKRVSQQESRSRCCVDTRATRGCARDCLSAWARCATVGDLGQGRAAARGLASSRSGCWLAAAACMADD